MKVRNFGTCKVGFSKVVQPPVVNGVFYADTQDYPWQLNLSTLPEYVEHDLVRIVWPTGAGKTTGALAHVYMKLQRNPRASVIIIVPETLIATGWANNNFVLHNGTPENVAWSVANLADDLTEKVKKLKAFVRLQQTAKHLPWDARVIITTRQAFTIAFPKVEKATLKQFRNTILLVDEFHHVKNGVVESNQLGKILDVWIRHRAKYGLGVISITATEYRDDGHSVLPEHLWAQFRLSYVPLHVYLPYSGIQTIRHSFIVDYQQERAIAALFPVKQPVPATMLWVPATAGWLDKSELKQRVSVKSKKVQKLLQGIGGPGAVITATTTLWLVKRRDGSVLKVMDFITQTNRDARKTWFTDPTNGFANANSVDVVLAMGLCKEGVDWPKAARAIVLTQRGLREANQMMGRILRPFKGKKFAEVVTVLKILVARKDHATKIDQLLNHIIFTTTTMEMLTPVEIKDAQGKVTRPLVDKIDAETLTKLQRLVVTGMLMLDPEPKLDEYKRAFEAAWAQLKLDKRFTADEKETIKRALWIRLLRSGQPLTKARSTLTNPYPLATESPLAGLRRLFADINVQTLVDVRTYLFGQLPTRKQAVAIHKAATKEAGGVPNLTIIAKHMKKAAA